MADRRGYTVTKQEPPNAHGQVTWRVNRDSDGAGLGAYHDDEGIDGAIAADRQHVAATRDANREKQADEERKAQVAEAKAGDEAALEADREAVAAAGKPKRKQTAKQSSARAKRAASEGKAKRSRPATKS